MMRSALIIAISLAAVSLMAKLPVVAARDTDDPPQTRSTDSSSEPKPKDGSLDGDRQPETELPPWQHVPAEQPSRDREPKEQEGSSPIGGDGTRLESFVESIADHIDRFWSEEFAANGEPYSSPNRAWTPMGDAPIACGDQALQGPGYCAENRTIALSAPYFRRIWRASGDGAVILVLAHEWGHHGQESRGRKRTDYYNIQWELQADCLAGAFLMNAAQHYWLGPHDIDDALRMAWRAGDSILVPWYGERALGSPEQRRNAVQQGFSGRDSCNVYTD